MIIVLLLSVLIGLSLGLMGGGGSILAVPVLKYVAGLEAKAAIAGLEGQELGGRPLRVREYYSA